LTFPKWQNHEL